jgi:ABC-type glycerol-3-phosphate transport system permease component
MAFLIIFIIIAVYFLYGSIKKSFGADSNLINAETVKFDLENYEKIKSKLPSAGAAIVNTANTSTTNTNINTSASTNTNAVK